MSDSNLTLKSKAQLRAEAMNARQRAATTQGNAAAQLIRRHGLEFFDKLLGSRADKGAIVAGYQPIRSEIDPLPLLEALHERGVALALPVIQPDPSLIFRRWRPGDVLRLQKFGLREPSDGNPDVNPNILLVPLLAFDRWGRRLGYGGGYYDAGLRSLRKLGPVLAIGLAYNEQEMAEIPQEEQDELLDFVLTPSGLIRCGE